MCGTHFQASNSIKMFCCAKCKTAFHKTLARDKKIGLSMHSTFKVGIERRKAMFKETFLTVGEAAFLLGRSKSTVYAMIHSGGVGATNFSERLTRLFREDIFLILDERIRHDRELMEQRTAEREDRSSNGYYRVEEAMSMFKKTKEATYAYCRRNKIGKVKIGKEILLSRDGIEKLYRKFKGARYMGLDREREANRKLANKKYSIDECYSVRECETIFGRPKGLLYGIFARRCVPKLKRGRNIFFPRTVIREMFDLIKKGGIVRKVKLRKKAISNGQQSLFLDIYPPVPKKETGKLTRKFYLGLYVYDRPATELQRLHNKETWALAEAIRARTQLEQQQKFYFDMF